MKSTKMLFAVLVMVFAFSVNAQQVKFVQYSDGTCAVNDKEVADVQFCATLIQQANQAGADHGASASQVDVPGAIVGGVVGGVVGKAIGNVAFGKKSGWSTATALAGAGVGALYGARPAVQSVGGGYGGYGGYGVQRYGVGSEYAAIQAEGVARYRSERALACQAQKRVMFGRSLTVDDVNSCAVF